MLTCLPPFCVQVGAKKCETTNFISNCIKVARSDIEAHDLFTMDTLYLEFFF